MTRKTLTLTFYLFLCSVSLFAVSIKMINTDDAQKIMEVDENTDTLDISLYGVKEIHGINLLPNLRKLKVGAVFSKENADIWKEFEKIETLVIDSCEIYDFSFLKYLPNLVAFSIWEQNYTYYSHIKGYTEIDLSNNNLLEYFEINSVVIDIIPKFINVPDSLLHVIIADNFGVDEALSDQFDVLKGKNIILYVDKELKEEADKIENLDVHEYTIGEVGVLSIIYNVN